MEKIFENKVALITGASYGIGSATAIAFAQRGAKVVVADWIEDKEEATMKGIQNAGHDHNSGLLSNIFVFFDFLFQFFILFLFRKKF